jgi:hypothetical protein
VSESSRRPWSESRSRRIYLLSDQSRDLRDQKTTINSIFKKFKEAEREAEAGGGMFTDDDGEWRSMAATKAALETVVGEMHC